jgi:NADH-quinone oxidoreductase subunit I
MKEYCRKVWLGFYTVLLGMKVTLRYLFAPAITLQYPDERWEIPEGSRGKLDVYLDDCIGCMQCARACPPECITIQAKKAPPGVVMAPASDGTKRKMVVPVFDIDLTKCLYCGLCVEACPTPSIRMTKDYEYSVYDRDELLLSFGRDLDPAIVAAAAEKVAAEKAEAEKAEAEKAEAPEGASGKPAVKADAGDPAGEAKPKPKPAGKAEPKADAGDPKGAAKRKPAGGAEPADGSQPQSKGPAMSEKPKPGANAAPGDSPDKTKPE